MQTQLSVLVGVDTLCIHADFVDGQQVLKLSLYHPDGTSRVLFGDTITNPYVEPAPADLGSTAPLASNEQ